MTWYLRKSVKVGPIRFNLSKSGIGTSVGVTGFRIGIRPNGSSYVHAGRYGVYYREELGNIRSNKTNSLDKDSKLYQKYNESIKYDSIQSSDLINSSKTELISKINKSYNSFRFDYLIGIMSILIILSLWNESYSIRIITLIISTLTLLATILWESKRRTVEITYTFEKENTSHFELVISAFNQIAINSKIWSIIDSRNLYYNHESKLNSGAGSLINRHRIHAGEGKPPWVKTNIKIPLIKSEFRSLYFMPDGILIYDQKGVGFVDYGDINVSYETTRFIEEKPPRDAQIVDYTWKYPNKDGGPDRRFSNNYKIPICLYGELKVETDSGLLLYIQTSKPESSENFYHDFIKLNTNNKI